MGNADSVPHGVMPIAQHRVQLAATPITPFIPMAARAYHTSVIVDDVEHYFCRRGIVSARNFQSHVPLPNGPDSVVDIGYSQLSGSDMVKALRQHFREATYDLLRKNCNSFTECAIYFLCGKRLDSKYSELEQIGTSAEQSIGLVRMLSMGEYRPNPRASHFRLDDILEKINSGKSALNKENSAPSYKQKPLGVFSDEVVLGPKASNIKLAQKNDIVDMGSNRPTLLEGSAPFSQPLVSNVRIPTYSMGQHVKVFSNMHRSWVGAKVKCVTPDGTVTVLYDSGEHQKDVPPAAIPNTIRLHDAYL